MVCCAVKEFGRTRPVCNARPVVDEALTAYESGDLIAAGCLLREGIRLYLAAECEVHDCMPTKNQRRSAGWLLTALRKAGAVGPGAGEWIQEMIETCNELAHCQQVRPSLVESTIQVVYEFFDEAEALIDFPKGGAR